MRETRRGAASGRAPFFFGGWSLVELVIMMIVAGILALFAVRTFQPKEALALEQAERLRNDLRHAQMLALTWGIPLRVTTGANSYQVCCATAALTGCLPAMPVPAAPCAVPDPVIDPATGRPFLVNLEPGLTLAGPGFTLNFDSLGRPRNGAALIAADATFTINGASVARTAVVAPFTGFTTAQ